MFQDVRIAIRQLVKRPGWAIAVIVVLALGIGANTAMFSGFEAWVLRPLDFDAPEQLVAVREAQPQLGRESLVTSAENFGDWMEQQQSFQAMGAYQGSEYNWNDENEPVRLEAARVSWTLFPTLRKNPILGRNFTAAEDTPGNPARVALISHELWQERFDGNPGVVGRTARLDGEVHEIVGVMEPGFKFPAWSDIWTPLGLDPHGGSRGTRSLEIVARLRDGVTIESARSDMEGIAERLARLYPDSNYGYTIRVISLRAAFVPTVIEIALTASLASALLVLLVICANVTSLILAQAAARGRETAVRSALGASRFRLMLQSIVEGVVLAVPAGVLGAYIGVLGLRSMLAYVPVEPPYLFRMGFSETAGIYTLSISVFAGIVCGLAPIVRGSGARLYEALKTGGREGGGREAKRFRSVLVAGELALTTALLIGALLMAKSFIALQAEDPGFRKDGVLTTELSLNGSETDPTSFAERIAALLQSQPGVESVGVTSHLPASQGYRVWGLVAQDRTYDIGEDVDATVHATLGDYFETLAIPFVAGRDFTDLEEREGAAVAIVSTELGRELWSEEDPVGRRLRIAGREDAPWLTVVGVVTSLDIGRDMVSWGEIPGVQLYVPFGAAPTTNIEVVLFGTAPERELASSMRSAFRRAAPSVPLSEVLTMDDAIFRVRWVASYFSRQLAVYALLATMIAAVGLYGVTADSVSRRTRELAIRTALGAERSNLVRLILGEAVKLGGLGVVIGLVLSLGVTRFASRMLVDVDARDPVVFLSVAALLLAVVVGAAILPARKATSLDPNRALRAE